MRRAGERSRPGSREQELGPAIARILRDQGLRLKLEACTLRIGEGKGTMISAVEMLSERAGPAPPDERSLVGAATRIVSDEMLVLTLRMYRSGTNGASTSAADVLSEYAQNPKNWERAGWGLAVGHG
jgi:hypothetical protein